MIRKKHIIFLIVFLLIFSGIVFLFFCSDNSKSSQTTSADNSIEKDALTILDDALFQFEQQELRGIKTTYHSYYTDGSTEKLNESVIFDSINQLVSSVQEYNDGSSYENILVKTNGNVFSYIKDSTQSTDWYRYAEAADTYGETSFDYILQTLQFSITEENGYSKIHISKAGEDMINGTSYTKIKITAELEATDGASEEDDSFRITRQDIIDENEWSEESIQAVDGFSDLLDNYVEYLNNPSDIDSPDATEEEYIVWIDTETSQLLQIEGTIFPNYSNETTADIESEFWNRCWEVSWIQADLDSGVTLEDSLATLEDDRENIEAQILENIEVEEGEAEKELSLEKTTFIQTYMTGSSCPPITLPENYIETTSEDYYNEFSDEYDQFIEDDYIE